MVKCIVENQDFLKSVALSTRSRRKNLISTASPEQIKAFHQITNNVAEDVVPLKPCVIKKIIKGRYRSYIKAAADKRTGIETRQGEKYFISTEDTRYQMM